MRRAGGATGVGYRPQQGVAPTAAFRRDPKSCGNRGVICPNGWRCDEGLCVPDQLPQPPQLLDLPLGRWYERGPLVGGRLDGIVATRDGTTLVVSSPGGGVWRQEGGSTRRWRRAGMHGLFDFTLYHLEWDLRLPDRLWGVGHSALFFSDDLGDNWRLAAGSVPARILPATIPPSIKPFAQLPLGRTRAVLYSRSCDGLWYGFEGELPLRWSPLSDVERDTDQCIQHIVPDSADRRVYVHSMDGSSAAALDRPSPLFRTGRWAPFLSSHSVERVTDGISNLNEESVRTLTSVRGSSAGDRMIAVTGGRCTDPDHPEATIHCGRVYALGGSDRWRSRGIIPDRQDPSALISAPGGDELFLGSVDTLHSRTSRDLLLGAVWDIIGDNADQQHSDTRGLYLSAELERVWAVTDGSSGDRANVASWQWRIGERPGPFERITEAGLAVWQAYYVEAVPNPGGGRRLFAGSQDNGALCFEEGLLPGPNTRIGAPNRTGSVDQIALVRVGDIGYARENNGNVFQMGFGLSSAARCREVIWKRLEIAPGEQQSVSRIFHRNTIAVGPADDHALYVLQSDSVRVVDTTSVTRDTPSPVGVDSRTILGPVAAGGDVLLSSLSFDAAGRLCVGSFGAGIFCRDSDSGEWSEEGLNAGVPPPPEWILGLALGPDHRWAATSRGLYHQRVGPDQPWLPETSRLYVVSDVEGDPTCASRVYAAYGYGGSRQRHRGGVLFTDDSGEHWYALTLGTDVHESPVTDVEVDSANPRYVWVSTFGRGVWLYDWATSLPECQDGPA